MIYRPKGVIICPICGNSEFVLTDGFHLRFIDDRFGKVKLGGVNVPCITLICGNCGFNIDFALGALDLLEKAKEEA